MLAAAVLGVLAAGVLAVGVLRAAETWAAAWEEEDEEAADVVGFELDPHPLRTTRPASAGRSSDRRSGAGR